MVLYEVTFRGASLESSVLFLTLVKITLVDAYIHLYCYYVDLCESAALHVQMFMFKVLCTLAYYIHDAYWLC